jgi:hypothetical protein
MRQKQRVIPVTPVHSYRDVSARLWLCGQGEPSAIYILPFVTGQAERVHIGLVLRLT